MEYIDARKAVQEEYRKGYHAITWRTSRFTIIELVGIGETSNHKFMIYPNLGTYDKWKSKILFFSVNETTQTVRYRTKDIEADKDFCQQWYLNFLAKGRQND